MSILIICYASDITGYDRKTLELSDALPHMKQDTLYQYRAIDRQTNPSFSNL